MPKDAKAAKPKTAIKDAKSAKKEDTKKPSPNLKYVAAIVIIIIILAFAILFAQTSSSNNQNSNFSAFKHNFETAPRVDIFSTAYNGTVESGTVGCATAIIIQIISNKTNHRNASTIDYNIINNTKCIRSVGLGNINSSKVYNTSLQNCLNTTKGEPTIYINYSKTNSTIIKPNYMYISGTQLFLSECGVASQIS
ncbi:MAG: hypothetical protein ABR981_01160 [Candidatus Micrarchaeaceae archaeon]|jgi:hypothetical protein